MGFYVRSTFWMSIILNLLLDCSNVFGVRIDEIKSYEPYTPFNSTSPRSYAPYAESSTSAHTPDYEYTQNVGNIFWTPYPVNYSPYVQDSTSSYNYSQYPQSSQSTVYIPSYAYRRLPLNEEDNWKVNAPKHDEGALPNWKNPTYATLFEPPTMVISETIQLKYKGWQGADNSLESRRAEEMYAKLAPKHREMWDKMEAICKFTINQMFDAKTFIKPRAIFCFKNYRIGFFDKNSFAKGYLLCFQFHIKTNNVPTIDEFCTNATKIKGPRWKKECITQLTKTFGKTKWEAVKKALYDYLPRDFENDFRARYLSRLLYVFDIDAENMPNTVRFCRNYIQYDAYFNSLQTPVHKESKSKFPWARE